ncbi:formate dehydrogenase accessory sulfurtransferase FdhD [Marinomonas epiphytica]
MQPIQATQFKVLTSRTINDESTSLVVEIPASITVNGIAHAIMMVTPSQLEAFAIGFAFSEQIINDLDEIRDINISSVQKGSLPYLQIDLELSPRCLQSYKQQKHVRLGATGCGLCGSDSIEHAFPNLAKLKPSLPLPQDQLIGLRKLLAQHQIIGQETGAIHGALLLDPEGQNLACMEDIGRHNAIDKLIGHALLNKLSLYDHSIVTSSRCSTELVLKAVRAKLSCLIHLASPSTLAVTLARQYGLTLIHLTKHDGPRQYS